MLKKKSQGVTQPALSLFLKLQRKIVSSVLWNGLSTNNEM